MRAMGIATAMSVVSRCNGRAESRRGAPDFKHILEGEISPSSSAADIGEVFGDGVAPVIAGYVANHFGIQHVMNLGFVALAVGLVVTLCLKETAPSRLRSQQPAVAQ